MSEAQIASDSEQRSRLPLLLAILLLVLLAGGAGFWLLGMGSDETVPLAADPATETDTATVVEPGDDTASDPAVDEFASLSVVPVTYEVFLARDPFEPVVEPEATPVASDSDGSGTAGDTDPDGAATGGTDDGNGVTDPGESTPGELLCRGREEVVCEGHVVTLVDIVSEDDEALAVIQVDTTIHEVRRGARFADSFELRSIDGSCASLLYGDEAFQLCKGDRVLK